jgi:hypothetical protein
MLRRAMLSGDGSTLSLDFTQMSTLADLTSRGLTFSRSTSGTFINANGLVATATAGNPRFEYDTNGNPRGILIEGNATNLVYHSETFRLTAVATEPYWADSASLSRGTDTAPDGTAGAAVNFVAIGTAGTVIQTSAVGTSANRTFSFWARRTGGGTVEYTLDNGSTWTAVTITASWVRYTATATNANQRVGFRVATGAGTSIWGAMLEAGSGSSSYIPSGASQGSRAVDACFTTSISLWFTNGPGTIVAHSDNIRTNTRNLLAQISDGTANNYVQVGLSAVAASGEAIGTLVGGALQGFSQSGSSPSLNTVYKSAYVWDTNYFRVCQNGTLSTADTTGTLATALDRLAIGTDVASSSPTDVYMKYGHIRLLKYWPTRLSDAQLQALTT